jgi:hypothetical protein
MRTNIEIDDGLMHGGSRLAVADSNAWSECDASPARKGSVGGKPGSVEAGARQGIAEW